MTTDKHIEANRRNARKSTGPRTEEGKARSARNATKHGLTAGNGQPKHGLTAETIVLPGEDMAHFEAFRFGLFESLRPEGAYETQLVLRLAAQQWRLQRIPAIEAGLWERLTDPTPELTAALSPWNRGSRNAESAGWVPDLAQSWMNDGEGPSGGALGRLARYETALERSCIRITAELRRAQRHRMERLAEDQNDRMERLAEDQSDRPEMEAEDRDDPMEMKKREASAYGGETGEARPSHTPQPEGTGRDGRRGEDALGRNRGSLPDHPSNGVGNGLGGANGTRSNSMPPEGNPDGFGPS